MDILKRRVAVVGAGSIRLRYMQIIRDAGHQVNAFKQRPQAVFYSSQIKNTRSIIRMDSLKRRVAVIGAGNIGLMYMRIIRDAGHEVKAFEQRSQAGGMWNFKAQRKALGYDEYNPDGSVNCAFSQLRLNTSKATILTSDDLLGSHQNPHFKEQFIDSGNFQKVLNETAKHFDLISMIKFNTVVNKVEKIHSGKKTKWSVTYSPKNQSENEVEKFDFVVCCSGGFRFPKMPEISNREAYKGLLIHSGQVRVEEALFKGKKVLVLGGSFSGTDMTCLSLKSEADKVYWCLTRNPEITGSHWLIDRSPPGSDPNKPFDLNFSRYAWFDKPDITQDFLTKICTKIGDGTNDKFTLPSDKIGVTDIPFMLNSFKSGKLVLVKPVKCLTANGVQFTDGTTVLCDIVVCATGFQSRFPVLDELMPQPLQNKNELYNHCIPVQSSLDGLAIAGCTEAITSKTVFYELLARWLTKFWLTRSYDQSGLLFTSDERAVMTEAIKQHKSSLSPALKFTFVPNIWAFSDSIASELGCLPPDYRDLICNTESDLDSKSRQVELGIALMKGPMMSMQYRLTSGKNTRQATEFYIQLSKKQLGAEEFNKEVQVAMVNPRKYLENAGIDPSRKYQVKPYFKSLIR